MAKLGYAGFSQMRGSAGDYTFSKVGTATIVRRRIGKRGPLTSTPGILTEPQMRQLTKAANVINLYRVMKNAPKNGYPDLSKLISSYNRWFGFNMAASAPSVMLTRDVAQQGGAVVAPYIFTVGSLPSVEVSQDNGRYSTNIRVSIDITDATTVAAISDDLLANNPNLELYDQISFVRFNQYSDANSIPRVSVDLFRLIVDTGDNTPLYNSVLSSSFQSNNGFLGTSTDVASGGFVYVVSRRKNTSSELLVSSQRIIVVNNSSILGTVTSDAAYLDAADSYGGTRDGVFLDPTNRVRTYGAVEGGQDTDANPTVSYFSVSNNGNTYTAAQTTQPTLTAGQVTLTLQGSNLQTSSAALIIAGQTVQMTAGTRNEQNATFTYTLNSSGSLQAVIANGQTIKTYSAQQQDGGGVAEP